jgi:hypothetical protein
MTGSPNGVKGARSAVSGGPSGICVGSPAVATAADEIIAFVYQSRIISKSQENDAPLPFRCLH